MDFITLFRMDSSARLHGSGIFSTDTGQGVSFVDVTRIVYADIVIYESSFHRGLKFLALGKRSTYIYARVHFRSLTSAYRKV